jgi:uncharacterized protein with HEPN domain
MKRDYKLYLNDIKNSISQIEKYVGNISEEEFKKSKLVQDAVIRRLEVIGEASKNIPRALKEKNKNIPWIQMTHFRDFMAHSYFEASLSRIWKTAKEDIKLFKDSFDKIKLV